VKLWLVTQDSNMQKYAVASMVVCAETENDASKIHPFSVSVGHKGWDLYWSYSLQIRYIGEAASDIQPNSIVIKHSY
jgi:hypothetical protein